MTKNTLEARSFYSEPQLNCLAAAIEDYNILSDLGSGTHKLSDIYEFCKNKLEWCCTGDLVEQPSKGNGGGPRWKHTIRFSLDKLKRLGVVDKPVERGYWIIKG
tara:strand:- start:49 stop:360 length:312 start_codon:yes stop_codon:yes gene_type:complete